MDQNNTESIDELVIRATNNFTKILSTNEIKEKYKELYWGGNGVGDRWVNKKFNYSVIYSKKQPSLYSENDDDEIPAEILNNFLQNNKGLGIIGIFVLIPHNSVEIFTSVLDLISEYAGIIVNESNVSILSFITNNNIIVSTHRQVYNCYLFLYIF